MIPCSKRGMAMPASPIRKLSPLAEQAAKQGIEVLHLNIGQPDIATPQPMLEAIKNSADTIIEYGNSAGNESYRQSLAKNYYSHICSHVSADDILITTGASEAILFSFFACADYGDEIIIPEPFYANYVAMAVATGIRIKTVSSSIHNQFALPDVSKIEQKITAKTKAILLCNPNNPTGYVYSKAELESLVNIAVKHNIYLIVDEVYREFCYTDEHYSVLQFQHGQQHIVLLDSVSKRYSACGLRVGCIVSKNKQLIATILKFSQARLSPPHYAQIAAEAALQLPELYFEQTKQEYQQRRDFVFEKLSAIPGVTCYKPKGAFYMMIKLPVKNAEHFCEWMLTHFQHQQATVMLAPGNGFYLKANKGSNQVRIAYVLNKEKLEKAINCLHLGLLAYKKQF